MPHVAVIGAGIVGLSTAVVAQEKISGLQVTLISQSFSPNTTGDGSAGLWKPHCLKNTPQSDIIRWSSKTYYHMLKLWESVDAGDIGVSLIPTYQFIEHPSGPNHELPHWSNVPIAFQIISKHQAQKLAANDTTKYTGGRHFVTFTLEPSKFLPYLTKKFILNGGKIQHHKVENLEDLCGQHYDAIINCTGLDSRHLLGDELVSPVRGQVMRVYAPSLFHVIIEEKEEGSYIIPNEDCVILGGTLQDGDWNTQPDPKDSNSIHEGCCNLVPGLKAAAVMNEWVGLRPSRTKVRLERDLVTDKNGKKLEVVHNYGHGGSGVTLCWGCAHDTVALLQEILNGQELGRSGRSEVISKL